MIGARAFVAALLSWALVQLVVFIGVESVSSVISQNIKEQVCLDVPILVAVGVSAWIGARTNRLLGRKKAVASAAASLVGIAVVVRLLWLSFYWLFWGGIQKDPVLQADHHGSNAFENGSLIHSKQQ